MTSNKRPISVTVLAGLYLVVGAAGFVFHFSDVHARNLFQYDGIWIEAVEILAVVCGVFLLRGSNWARWLAVAWMAFHVVLSAFGAARELVIHSIIFVAIAWLLFRADAGRFFRPPRSEPE